MNYTIKENDFYELDLHLSMAQKINDNEIDIEQGKYPVDKEHAISLYLLAAVKVLRRADRRN